MPLHRTLDDALAVLTHRLRETSDRFEAELAALPNSRPCRRHPGHTAVLLIDASWKAARPVYGCALCADDVRAARRRRRLDEAGIPADVRHATFDNFALDRPGVNTAYYTPAQFLAAALKFRAGEVRNLILAGTPGIGKGHLAAALALEALDTGRTVAWTDCASLFSTWHAAYKDGTTPQVRERHTRPALTVLDEAGLRDLPADGEEILFSIIDTRHKAARPTLILSNKNADDIRTWLGGRITDRLRSGGCTFRYGEWESMRGKAGDGADGEF